MPALLATRPAAFVDVRDALQWAVASEVPRQRAAAALSVPPQLRRDEAHGAQ